MTVIEPAEPVAETEGEDTGTDLGLFTAGLGQSVLELEAIRGVDEVQQWLDQMHEARAALEEVYGEVVGPQVADVLDQIGEGVRDGNLTPADAPNALSWIVQTHGAAALTTAWVTGGGMAAAILLYDTTHGKAIKTPAATAKASTTPSTGAPSAPVKAPAAATKGMVTPLGGGGPVVTTGSTAGDKLVEAAEKAITPRRIEAPDVSEETAAAISWASGVVYEDATRVMATVTTEVLARVDQAIKDAKAAKGTTTKITEKVTTTSGTTTTQYDNLLKRVENLQGDVQHALTEIQVLQRQPSTSGKATQPKTGEVTPTTIADLQSQISTVRKVQENHGSAITSIFGKIAPIVPLAAVAPALSQLSPKFIGDLPPTITQEEGCCEENMEQTQPLKNYGGASKLISDLKGALTSIAELGIVLSILGTIATILDAPAALLGTYRAATWVAPIAEAAANVALADVSWADTVHGPVTSPDGL